MPCICKHMFPTGFPAPQFCCSIFCQEILLLCGKNGSLTNPFALQVEGLLLGGAQKRNPAVSTEVSERLPVVRAAEAHTAPVRAACPGFTSHGNKGTKTAVVLMHAGSHRNMGRDVARGHSQTWEFGSTPRFPYTVRALLSEGQKLSH